MCGWRGHTGRLAEAADTFGDPRRTTRQWPCARLCGVQNVSNLRVPKDLFVLVKLGR